MPAVETMALWVAIVALGAQIKAMAGTGKREKEKIRLLREQVENTRTILKLLEDKQRAMPPDPAMNEMLRGLRAALDDISSSPERADELDALDRRISSILHQYHHYYHREAPSTSSGGGGSGSGSDTTTGDWVHLVKEIVENAEITVQGAWYAWHNMEEVLRVAQLAQQVADLLTQHPHATSRLMRDPDTTWQLVSGLRDALRDARCIVWFSQWYHLSSASFPPPQTGVSLQPAHILDAAVKKIEFCLQVLPAIVMDEM